ncbi:hypothetical protein JXA59_03215 [Patescibacteria group bacterium]|nr:hypothetical protein [Patescibacteria group bacterium]
MRYPKVISLLLGLVLIGLGGWGVVNALLNKNEVQPTLAAGSFLQLDYIQEDAAFVSELASAHKQASSWNAQAKLAAISIRFDGGLDYNFLTRYVYVFQAPEATTNYVVNNPRVAKDIRSTYDQSEIFGETLPEDIVQEYLKINFTQALEIVEQAGGSSFRANHSGNYSVNLLLMQPERDILSWVVSYQSKSGQDELVWRVNAASGSVELQ